MRPGLDRIPGVAPRPWLKVDGNGLGPIHVARGAAQRIRHIAPCNRLARSGIGRAAVNRQFVADHLVDNDALGRKDQGHGFVELFLIANIPLEPDRSIHVGDGDFVARN